MPIPQTPSVTLNSQTVLDLIEQTESLINLEDTESKKKQVLLNLKTALESVKMYVPYPSTNQTDEVSLENEIREEIVIAGANENG